MGAAPSTNIHTASNPFYNMAAPSVAPSQQVPVSFTQGNRVSTHLLSYKSSVLVH